MDPYNLVWVIARILLLIMYFAIPGFALKILTESIRRKTIAIPEFSPIFIIETIGLSICSSIIIGTALALAGLFNPTCLGIYLLVSVGIAIAAIISKSRKSAKRLQGYPEKNSGKHHEKKSIDIPSTIRTAVFVISIIIASAIILKIHADYSGDIISYSQGIERKAVTGERYMLPMHGDEWTHIAQSRYIMEEGRIPFHNPYFDSEDIPYKITGILESGFHVLIATIFILFSENIVSHYAYLPALWIALSGLFIFITSATMTRRLISNISDRERNIEYHLIESSPFVIGSISAVLISAFTNSPNIPGFWFFIPVTVAIGLSFLAITYYADNELLFCGISIAAIAMTYLPVAAVCILAFIATSIISWKVSGNSENIKKNIANKKKNKKSRVTIFVVAIIILITITTIPIMIASGKISVSKDTLDNVIRFTSEHLIYGKEQFDFDEYPFMSILGITGILSILGLVSAIFLIWWKKSIMRMDRGMITGAIIFVILLINWLIFKLTGNTIMIRLQRDILFLSAISAAFTALFIFFILYYPIKFLAKKNIRPRKWKECHVACLAIMSALVIIISIAVISSQDAEHKNKIYHIIENKDAVFLDEVHEMIGEGKTIIANPLPSMAVYPITGNHVVSISGGNLNYGDKKTVKRFADTDCKERVEIMREKRIDYVWTTFEAGCNEFEIVLQEGYNRLYGIKQN